MKSFEFQLKRYLVLISKVIFSYLIPFSIGIFFYYIADNVMFLLLPFLFITVFFLIIPLSLCLNYYILDRYKNLQLNMVTKEIIIQKEREKWNYSVNEIKRLELWKNHSFRNNWGMYHYYKIIPKDDNKMSLYISCLIVKDLHKELPEIPFEERSAFLPYMWQDAKYDVEKELY
ncbi:MAG: hypothetical protein LBR81_08680 [Prevotellaceae bacterium]|jgi:hypothetical protein|nr:hypothetical protein [Prevotellaceae bacterium]